MIKDAKKRLIQTLRMSNLSGIDESMSSESPISHQSIPSSQTNSNQTLSILGNNDEFFQNYEVIRLEAQPYFYKDQKTLILTVQNISSEKAQFSMLHLHTRMLSEFSQKFISKIERMEITAKNTSTDNFFDTLLETLGNSYHMLNSMQHIQHQFQVMSGQNEEKNVDFLLADEVKYAIQGISLSMSPNVSFNFTYENNLPQQVHGNKEKFKLVILTVLEFSIKYCSQGVINVKVDFDSLSDNRETFMVSFSICMQLNKAYNEKPLMDFLNEFSKKKDQLGTQQQKEEE